MTCAPSWPPPAQPPTGDVRAGGRRRARMGYGTSRRHDEEMVTDRTSTWADIAARQHGCIHRDQFDGPPDRAWVPSEHPDVWDVQPTGPTGWAAAALLAVDPGCFTRPPRAVLSHTTAAKLWGAGVFAGGYHITATVAAESGTHLTVHPVGELPDWCWHHGLPVTAPAATIVAIAAVPGMRDHVGRAASDMLRRGLCDRADLDHVDGLDEMIAEFEQDRR